MSNFILWEKNFKGWGLKVIAAEIQLFFFDISTVFSRIFLWARCIPSKLPMHTDTGEVKCILIISLIIFIF